MVGGTERALGLERLEVAGSIMSSNVHHLPSRSHGIFPAPVQGISAPAFTAEEAVSCRRCLPGLWASWEPSIPG